MPFPKAKQIMARNVKAGKHEILRGNVWVPVERVFRRDGEIRIIYKRACPTDWYSDWYPTSKVTVRERLY